MRIVTSTERASPGSVPRGCDGLVGTILAACCLLSSLACGQESYPAKVDAQTGPPQEWGLSASADSTYVFGGDLDGSNGEIDTWMNRLDLRASGPGWRGSWLTLGASWEQRHYDIEGSNSFLPGTDLPFEDVNAPGVSAMVLQGVARDWGILVGGSVTAAAEAGADLGDGLSWNAMAGVGHQFSDRFRAGLGVMVLSRFERDLLVIPALQLSWKISDQTTFKIEGPGAELEWKIDDQWQVAVGGRFESRRFRLDEDAPGFEGIVADYRLPIFLRARYQPEKDFDLEATVGLDVYREFQVEDRNGNNRRSYRADPAPFFGLSATLRF